MSLSLKTLLKSLRLYVLRPAHTLLRSVLLILALGLILLAMYPR